MTFILALAERSYGILATDTRSVSHGALGELDTSKLRELGGGAWGAGGGFYVWSARALDAVAEVGMRDLGTACRAVREVGEAADLQRLTDHPDALMAMRLAHNAGAFGELVVVYPSVAGYQLVAINSDGRLERYPRGRPYACVPPGIEVATMREQVYAGLPGVRTRQDAIHWAARLIQWCAAMTPNVTDTVELVVCTRGHDDHHPPTPAADILGGCCAPA